jgi:hypothetical protein
MLNLRQVSNFSELQSQLHQKDGDVKNLQSTVDKLQKVRLELLLCIIVVFIIHQGGN